ncbi:polyprenyl synthetase family protein [Actinoplanes sp. NPDC049265]|uniref:polyprenyl synthetase family protein n=1 Tax=Actinoplanes sp. NPDC049265 TaxID=3363902 RepID=UPI00371E5125
MVAVELGTPVRTVAALLEWSRATVDPPLRAAVATLPPATAELVDYHFGWRDAAGAPAREYAGKAVRPLLTLLAARAVGADAAVAVPAAVAVELVHNFSLVHDDIMDGDRTRRHRATLWNVHGVGPAILAGDAMLALAGQTIEAEVRAAALLGTAVQRLIDGQLADLAFERRGDVTPARCEAMAEAKTAALLSAATELGAVAGGGSPAACARLARFGHLIGLAFQFTDDLLGIWGDPAVTGKPVRSDLRTGKKSLPVVAALHSGEPAAAALAELYRDGGLTGADAARAADLIEECGARTWCQARADALLDEALRELAEAGSPAPAERELGTVARLLTRRDR